MTLLPPAHVPSGLRPRASELRLLPLLGLVVVALELVDGLGVVAERGEDVTLFAGFGVPESLIVLNLTSLVLGHVFPEEELLNGSFRVWVELRLLLSIKKRLDLANLTSSTWLD